MTLKINHIGAWVLLLSSTIVYAGSGAQIELSNTDASLGIFNDAAFEDTTPEATSNFGHIYTEARIATINEGDHIVVDAALEVARQVYAEDYFTNIGVGVRPAILSVKRSQTQREDVLAVQLGLKGYVSKELAGQIKVFGELAGYFSPDVLTISKNATASKYFDAKIGVNVIANTAFYLKLVRNEVDFGNTDDGSIELASGAMLGIRIGL